MGGFITLRYAENGNEKSGSRKSFSTPGSFFKPDNCHLRTRNPEAESEEDLADMTMRLQNPITFHRSKARRQEEVACCQNVRRISLQESQSRHQRFVIGSRIVGSPRLAPMSGSDLSLCSARDTASEKVRGWECNDRWAKTSQFGESTADPRADPKLLPFARCKRTYVILARQH